MASLKEKQGGGRAAKESFTDSKRESGREKIGEREGSMAMNMDVGGRAEVW